MVKWLHVGGVVGTFPGDVKEFNFPRGMEIAFFVLCYVIKLH